MRRDGQGTVSRPPGRLLLVLHGGVALVGIWAFYTLLFWGCLAALPHSEEATDDVARAVTAALSGLVAMAACAALSPWVLDRVLRVTWIELDMAGDVGPHLRGVLAAYDVPAPRLGVIGDADPCALTYGRGRRSARMVVTRGLLETLDVDGQCALVTHEAAHLVSGDFVVATQFAAPMLILSQVRRFLGRMGDAALAQGARPASGGFLMPVSSVLIAVYATLYSGFSQYREQWADRFARLRMSDQAYENGLLGVMFGLARPSPSAHALAVSARGFSPVDATCSGRMGTAAAWRGVLDADRLSACVQAAAVHAASDWTRQVALHPPPGTRLAPHEEAPSVRPPTAWLRLLRPVLPAAGFLTGVLICVWLGGWFGLPLMLWAVGRISWLALGHGRAAATQKDAVTLAALLEAAAGSAPETWVALPGRIVGFGVPGVTWCPDVVLESGGAFVALRPRVLGAFLREETDRDRLAEIAGRSCTARGVLRSAETPFLELHSLDVDGSPYWRSHFVTAHLVGSILLLLLGGVICAPQWMGF